jgi:arylsulfatase A-like enzyme
MYPTILAATGAAAHKQIQPLDGVNLLPLFEQKMTAREKAIPFWADVRRDNSHAALLDWPYKLHLQPNAGGGKGKNADKTEKPAAVLLYDVSKDPKESNDLAAQQPERVKKMTAALNEWRTSVRNSLAGKDYPSGSIEAEEKPQPAKPAAP